MPRNFRARCAFSKMRNVVVTGGSRGIGRAIAQRFASAGDRICVHYSSGRSQAEETVGSLVPSPLGEHFILDADLSKDGSARVLIETALSQFAGHLDVLVVNHGVYEETPFETCDVDAWSSSFQRLMQINLASPAELAFVAAKTMAARGFGGAIVMVRCSARLRAALSDLGVAVTTGEQSRRIPRRATRAGVRRIESSAECAHRESCSGLRQV